MGIIAGVHEWAFAFSAIEVFARYGFECSLVLLDEFILFGAALDDVVGRNNQVRVASAGGASAVVVLTRPFIIG